MFFNNDNLNEDEASKLSEEKEIAYAIGDEKSGGAITLVYLSSLKFKFAFVYLIINHD